MPELAHYANETLSALSVDALIDLLVHDEDRVPRNVIDECARRGEAMLDGLQAVLERGRAWEEDAQPGEWWLLLHAAMILGLMPGQRAGALLVDLMEDIDAVGDDDLEDWLTDRWAGLFANKPAEILDRLRDIARDRRRDWPIRTATLEALLEVATRLGRLEDALAWIAAIASDASEQRAVRTLFASHLLDFPREAHRALLLELARRQKSDERLFSAAEIEEVYAEGRDRPLWKTRANPWEFYHPDEIAERQRRWAEEEAAAADAAAPYVREAPKLGRNDPCPCGSGRKYKQCCMPK